MITRTARDPMRELLVSFISFVYLIVRVNENLIEIVRLVLDVHNMETGRKGGAVRYLAEPGHELPVQTIVLAWVMLWE